MSGLLVLCKFSKSLILKAFIIEKFLDTPPLPLLTFAQKVLTVLPPLELFSLERKGCPCCRVAFSFLRFEALQFSAQSVASRIIKLRVPTAPSPLFDRTQDRPGLSVKMILLGMNVPFIGPGPIIAHNSSWKLTAYGSGGLAFGSW